MASGETLRKNPVLPMETLLLSNCHVVAYGRLKNERKFQTLTLKVVAVTYERSLTGQIW